MQLQRSHSTQRRLILLSLTGLAGCDALSETLDIDGSWAKLSAEDKALKRKFSGLRGGELVVDAFGEKEGVNIFDESDKVFYQRATISAKNNSKHSYSADFGVPKILRAEWRDRYLSSTDPYEPPPPGHVLGAYRGGKILGNYTVPLAARIPSEVLDGVRQKKGGFRLKIRLHDDGLLIGWDLESRPGYVPGGPYVSAVHTMVGGDFREAEIVDGKAVRKGWYIHPKTGQKIETNF